MGAAGRPGPPVTFVPSLPLLRTQHIFKRWEGALPQGKKSRRRGLGTGEDIVSARWGRWWEAGVEGVRVLVWGCDGRAVASGHQVVCHGPLGTAGLSALI